MRADSVERLTFLATARAALLLGDRSDLDLRVAPVDCDETSEPVRVHLATSLDDIGGPPPLDQARLAVLEDVTEHLDDTRFDDCVFRSTPGPEIEFRARRALRRKAPALVKLGAAHLEVRGRSVLLSATEHRLLARLLARPGAPVARAELESAIADAQGAGDRAAAGRALDAHVYRLRRKLRAVPGVRLETLRQRGFSLLVERR